MHFHTFRDLPWAYLRLVFPERTLAFKPLELVRLDLVTTVSLVALGFRWEFIDTSADEVSDPMPRIDLAPLALRFLTSDSTCPYLLPSRLSLLVAVFV